MGECDASESSIRRSLYQLVEEDIIVVQGMQPTYYGFVGVQCTYVVVCDTVVPECNMFAHRCDKRTQFENEGNLDGEEEEANREGEESL